MDKALQLPDLVLAFLVLVPDHFLDQLTGFVPEFIIPDEHFDLPIVNVYDARTYCVEKMSVMGNNDDGSLVIQQKVLKPVDG